MIIPQTFHLFSNLPTELQDLIWYHAVRPVPGKGHVHNFIISDHYSQHSQRADQLRFGVEGHVKSGIRLSVPHERERYKWSKTTAALDGLKDESVYSTDGGLWMACRASRSAMEKYFDKNEWRSDMPGSDQPHINRARKGDFEGDPARPHTAAYYSSGQQCHEPSYVTIRPEEDLVILKHPGLSQVDWFHFYAWNSIPLFMVDRPSKGPYFLGHHIAFDYDPVWKDILDGGALRRCPVRITADTTSIVDMVYIFHESNDSNMLWFIDHRLKRRVIPPTEKWPDQGPRRSFRSVNYVYTEVWRQEMETHWVIEDHIEKPWSVWNFLNALESYPSLQPIWNSRRIGLLARELVPGSEGSVTITNKGYRNLLGDACFECPETKIRAEEKKPRIVRRKAEVDDEDDLDLGDLNLFGDDEA